MRRAPRGRLSSNTVAEAMLGLGGHAGEHDRCGVCASLGRSTRTIRAGAHGVAPNQEQEIGRGASTDHEATEPPLGIDPPRSCFVTRALAHTSVFAFCCAIHCPPLSHRLYSESASRHSGPVGRR